MNKVRIIENWTRNLGLPETWLENARSGDWEIWNAARPFPAHLYHQGEFMHGIFYGVIDPSQDLADEYRRRAIDLDASRLVFVTQEEVNTWGRAYCEELGVDFDNYEFDVIARSYLQHAKEEESEGE